VKKIILMLTVSLLLALGVPSSMAESNVQVFFVACADQAVMNLSGTIDPGFDVFYQVFSAASGTGTAITGMRRAQIDGTVAFSERLPYNSGTTVDAGVTASVRVVVGREDNIDSSTMDIFVNDVQDGCADPQNPTGTSVDTGAPVTTPGTVDLGPQIVNPFGGFLNANLSVTAEPIVVIGARTHESFRSVNAGLIFAECDAFPRATPGVIYDNDNIIIFWSWYASTEALAQDHIDHAQYAVTLNRQPFDNVVRSVISKRGANFFVFYTAQIGNIAPGSYGVEYQLTWDQAINDGFDDYGPGTPNSVLRNTCTFNVSRNVSGANPQYNLKFSY
jgi:hypothetical protein